MAQNGIYGRVTRHAYPLGIKETVLSKLVSWPYHGVYLIGYIRQLHIVVHISDIMASNGTVHSDLLALAENISQKTKEISDYLKANNLATPTFAAGSEDPPSTPEYLEIHNSLKASLEDLQRLVDGPRRHMRAFLLEGYDLAAFQVALDFGFFDIVPSGGEISLQELAQKAGLDLDRVSRIVRMMITHRFFQEKKPGVISHNNASYILQKDEEFRCTVHYT